MADRENIVSSSEDIVKVLQKLLQWSDWFYKHRGHCENLGRPSTLWALPSIASTEVFEVLDLLLREHYLRAYRTYSRSRATWLFSQDATPFILTLACVRGACNCAWICAYSKTGVIEGKCYCRNYGRFELRGAVNIKSADWLGCR